MYSLSEIHEMCKKALERVETFYQQDFINYRGKTTDTNQLYTEIVADFVLNNINAFLNNIPQITRMKNYNQKHDGVYREGTGRDEEIIAIKMFNQSQKDGYTFDKIGKIIDYQTPLKSKKDDKAGKIDLIAYDGSILRILELKKPSSSETMLRCVLEGYTYLKTVDQQKLLNDFELPLDTVVKASPLVFYGGEQYKEWQNKNPKLIRLMEELESEPYFIVNDGEQYRLFEGV